MYSIFDILFVPNIIVFVLACLAVSLKYEQYLKLHHAVVEPLSYFVRRGFYIIDISVADRLAEAILCFQRPINGWTRNRKSHSKLNHTDIGCNAELYTPFFSRPKPVITDLILQPQVTAERLTVHGANVPLWGSRPIELWINVTNEGKTPIKRMRARAKFHLITKTIDPHRPDGMKDEEWNKMVHYAQEFRQNIDRQFADSMFGKPLPFSRTPKGTVGFPWIQADGQLVYETDLTPRSDEASIKLVGIYHLHEVARRELANSNVLATPEGSKIVAHHIGAVSGTVTNPRDNGSLAFDLALKFWIVAENLTEEVSEIFHIQIPNSYDGISCIKLKKRSKQYNEFNKFLAV